MKESLDIQQSQQLSQRLSPRQVQYALLLEMTAPEVEEEVLRQLDDNPALEAVDANEPQADDYEAQAAEPDYDDDPADRMPVGRGDVASWQAQDDAGSDLTAYLSEQIGQTLVDGDIKRLALYIIGNLDPNGYLTRTLASMADDIAIATGREVDLDDMRKAFALVRELDPAGVGAVDLRDCMLLQLGRRQPLTLELKAAREIVADYFDLLSKKHYERLAAQMGIDSDTLSGALDIIRSLNPKPGSAMSQSSTDMRLAQITPDVAVECQDGRVAVSLVSHLPHLQIEKSFDMDSAEPPRNKREREAQAFVKLKRDDAEAFIAALRQRGATLVSVTEAIARRQADFFATGDTARLRPMILKDIAADTGYDLSTISRATAGKYVATELGVYPLKMFFNEAPTDDADTSSHEMMQAIKDIVDAEDKRHPLSDLAIEQAMHAKGYQIARRTITKYREKMGIPVGRLRKTI